MLEIKKTVLMVIDAQGRLARVVSQSELACRQVGRMVTAADLLSIPVLLTAQAPEKIGHTIPEIAALLAGQLEYPRVTFSVMGAPALVSALEELARTQVLLCGFETHICLYQAAIDLLGAGYEPWLLTDATSSRNPADKETALLEMSRCGVHLTTVEMALFSLLRAADHPAFKQISALIK